MKLGRLFSSLSDRLWLLGLTETDDEYTASRKRTAARLQFLYIGVTACLMPYLFTVSHAAQQEFFAIRAFLPISLVISIASFGAYYRWKTLPALYLSLAAYGLLAPYLLWATRVHLALLAKWMGGEVFFSVS